MSETKTIDIQPAQTETKEPPRITVVTSENFDQYVNEKLGVKPVVELSPEEKAAVELEKIEAEKTERLAADEPAHDLGEQVPKEKKDKLNDRFRELTTARKEAEAKATAAAIDRQKEAERAAKAEQDVAALRQKYEPLPPDDLGPEPRAEQFNDLAEYSKALKEWSAQSARKEIAAAQAKERSDRLEADRVKSWTERVSKAKETIPDYDAKLVGAQVKISNEMRDAILDSELGPQILVYLADNPVEAPRLASLTIGGMLREIGKLEAKLGSAEKTQPKSSAQVVEISKAPPPITPVKGSGATSTVKVNADGEFYGTYEEYKAARASGKIK